MMAAAVIIVYKTAILYETNIRLNYYNILNYRSSGDDGGSIIILQWQWQALFVILLHNIAKNAAQQCQWRRCD